MLLPAVACCRTTGREEYFYPSPEAWRLADQLQKVAGCDLMSRDVSCYEVGLDWGQMFTSKVHSTGFLMLR